MNIWDNTYNYHIALIKAMIEYADKINSNRDSFENHQALWDWVQLYADDFRKNWESEHGKVED